jgi:hypothetical protein
MNLAALLDELRTNILHDRSDRVAGTSDYLWTDDTLIRYIDEAQRRFARLGLVIRDGSTDEATLVTLVAGVPEYQLHESLIAVVSAKHADDKVDLVRVGHAALSVYRSPNTNFLDPASFATLPDGKPLAYTTDEQVFVGDTESMGLMSLRVYPAPSTEYAGTTIRLRVMRKPIERLSAANLNAHLEIPEEHHLEVLDWAAYLALRIVDIDAGMPDRAKEFAQAFAVHVQAARSASMRKLFAPAGWGFGRNGFSWER